MILRKFATHMVITKYMRELQIEIMLSQIQNENSKVSFPAAVSSSDSVSDITAIESDECVQEGFKSRIINSMRNSLSFSLQGSKFICTDDSDEVVKNVVLKPYNELSEWMDQVAEIMQIEERTDASDITLTEYSSEDFICK